MNKNEQNAKLSSPQIVVAIVTTLGLIIVALIQITPELFTSKPLDKNHLESNEVINSDVSVFCDIVIKRAETYEREFRNKKIVTTNSTELAIVEMWVNKFNVISEYDCESIKNNFDVILVDFEKAYNYFIKSS